MGLDVTKVEQSKSSGSGVIPTTLVDAKYGRIWLENPPASIAIVGDPEQLAVPDNEDEPAFLLRAQDEVAVPVIDVYELLWSKAAKAAGMKDNVANAFADKVYAVQENFRKWGKRNLEKLKLAD